MFNQSTLDLLYSKRKSYGEFLTEIGKDNNVASTSKKRVIKTNNNNLSSNNNSGLKLNVMSQNDMAKKAKATTTNSTTTKVVLKQLPLTQKMANQKGQKKVVFYAQY